MINLTINSMFLQFFIFKFMLKHGLIVKSMCQYACTHVPLYKQYNFTQFSSRSRQHALLFGQPKIAVLPFILGSFRKFGIYCLAIILISLQKMFTWPRRSHCKLFQLDSCLRWFLIAILRLDFFLAVRPRWFRPI